MVETLETRSMLSGIGSAVSTVLNVSAEPNETLDMARAIGNLSRQGAINELGTIGDGPAGAADVDWYEFSLDRSAQVTLTTTPDQGVTGFHGVLSLYNNDPSDINDPYDPLGHRLLVQGDSGATGGDDTITRLLGPGTYEVAVSGAGNTDFHPFIAGSGYPGTTGNFDLHIGAVAAGPGTGAGPAVLTSDPAPSAVLDTSPLVIRLDLSGALDPSTIIPGQTAQLIFNPDGRFGDGNDQPVPLAGMNFSSAINELQLTPKAPLAPGYYKVVLAGNAGRGQAVLAAPNSQPLGMNQVHPSGQDFTTTFQVDGINGIKGALTSDDTSATARDLGNVTGTGIVQVSGAIGVDPYYHSSDPNSPASNPANQVNLYHFQISGPGRYAFTAEVFAGRIGSPLTPGLSLYRLDPVSHTLQFVDGNIDSGNPLETASSDPQANDLNPLYTDPVLFDGLTQGDYYLAVAARTNTASPLDLQEPGAAGLYDPNVPHSATLGASTGPYVLNLMVQPSSQPPKVVATSPSAGAILTQPPTQLTVQFSEAVNLQVLAHQYSMLYANHQAAQDFLAAVYVQGADGTKYYPELASFDNQTDLATFEMADALANGTYQLHLSGAAGLSDYGGNPLVGNNPAGDYVATFTVNSPTNGQVSNPLQRTDQEPDNDPAQDLGVLFPHELGDGVTVTRDFSGAPAIAPSDNADVYRFQVLQHLVYQVTLSGPDLPAGTHLTLLDSEGHPVPFFSAQHGKFLTADLSPGTYLISVSGWTPRQAAGVVYQLRLSVPRIAGLPQPLLSGPAPALSFHLDGAPTPNVDPTPPSIVLTVPNPGSTATPMATSSFTAVGPTAQTIAATAAPHASSPAGGAFANATPGELVVLGFGPVGGVTGANAAASNASVQVALQDAAAPIGQSMIGLVTLTQRIDVGEALQTRLELSHAGPPLVSPPVAELAESSREAVPGDQEAAITFLGEEGRGRKLPSTIPQPDLPREVVATDAGAVAVVAADSPMIVDEVTGTPGQQASILDLAGLRWTSALAAIAAAALTFVAKRRIAQRLGLGRRSDEKSRDQVTYLPGHHAGAPKRSILARRRRRGAPVANRA